MKKKKITENNPQGVEYPEAVTADGKMVYAIDLDKKRGDCEGVHFFFLGCEGDKEEVMLFIELKHRNGVTKFFRHKQGYIGDRNEPDRYLHNYSELRLKQRFDESEQSGEFIVQYYVLEKCPLDGDCKFADRIKCQGQPRLSLKTLNLRDIYDTCTPEKGEDKYIADLLLTNSKDSTVKPMFLEVFVTHKCTEEKINSGYPIIEVKIENKEDADNEIIENACNLVDEYLIMSPDNAKRIPPIEFHGFDRSTEFTKYKTYGNFMLTKIGDNLVANYREVACNEIKDDTPPNCVFDLLIPVDDLNDIDPYEIGLAKASDMGFNLRDCTLCGRYKIPTNQSNINDSHPCRIGNRTFTLFDNDGRWYKMVNPYICNMPYRCSGFDKSLEAARCHAYCIDKQRISDLVRSLESMSKLMWVDDSQLHKAIEKDKSPTSVSNDTTIFKKKSTRSASIEIIQQGELILVPIESCRHSCQYNRWDCGHCLGSKKKEEHNYIICNREESKLLVQDELPTINNILFQENPTPVPF